MNIKVDFDNIVVKEDKNDFNVKVLMLKGEKGDAGGGEANIIEKVQVNGTDLPVTNKTVNVPVPIVDSAISSSSTNPVQNSAIYNALSNKVNTSALDNYYEVSEVDSLLSNKVNTSTLDNYYTKIQTYSKSETDTLLEDKADTSEIDTINSTLSTKANNSDVANIYETKANHNADILTLSSQISSLASGSPLVANSISEMTDTTKVYVNTSDGNWYYYNGSAWAVGDTYQSTEIADNSITRNKLSQNELAISGSPYYNQSIVNVDELHSGGFINGNTGVLTPGASGSGLDTYSDFFAVEPSTTYYTNGVYNNMVYYTSEKVFISGGGTSGPNGVLVRTTPSNCYYARVSLKSANSVLSDFRLSKTQITMPFYFRLKNLWENNCSLIFYGAEATQGDNSFLDIDWQNSNIILRNIVGASIINNKTYYNLYSNTTENDYTLCNFAGNYKGFKLIFFNITSNNIVVSHLSSVTNYSNDYLLIGYINDASKKLYINGYGNYDAYNPTHYYFRPYNNAPINIIHDSNTWTTLKITLPYGRLYSLQKDGSYYNIVTLENSTIYTLQSSEKLVYTISTGTFSVETLQNTNSEYSFDKILLLVNVDGYLVDGVLLNSINSRQIYKLQELLEPKINYVVGTDLIKKGIELTQIGTLSAHQSFCKYGNYFYSTDGTHIYKQDSSFTLVDTVDLNVGHGNAFQLGSSHYAYISGWNDNTIYVVDLDTLTLSSTINLPTTGYTTGVVDDVKGLCYIFQRGTYPHTNENYNFIVYDYVNEQIVSTKKTSYSFGAMQSADLFEDKIIVLNGLGGTDDIYNGYKVYDLNGNILSSYVINEKSTEEPEGVCIDRQTHDLYISYLDKKCYIIK